ncbi:MAG: M67 family metallopeptidase [Hadesarchaea archaeon]|nr:M67 family metallopeptidase [Hadesarchaea archaeon]
MKLRIKHEDLSAIERHSKRSFPLECCGLLIGRRARARFEVLEVVPAENLKRSPTLFEMDPQFVNLVLSKAESRGLTIVGFYHSHPGVGAFVSGRDAEFLKLWPGVAWLIISVANEIIEERRAYVCEADEIREIEIEVY